MRRPVAPASGFTLIEVVVALAILSLSVAAVMQIFSGGLKNIHRIDLAHQAMAHGENIMSEILSNQEILGPVHLSGDLDEEFSYSADVDEFVDSEQTLALPNVAAPNIALLSVHVRILFKNDRHGKFYQISSLKAVSLAEQDDMQGLSGDPIRRLFGRRTQ